MRRTSQDFAGINRSNCGNRSRIFLLINPPSHPNWGRWICLGLAWLGPTCSPLQCMTGSATEVWMPCTSAPRPAPKVQQHLRALPQWFPIQWWPWCLWRSPYGKQFDDQFLKGYCELFTRLDLKSGLCRLIDISRCSISPTFSILIIIVGLSILFLFVLYLLSLSQAHDRSHCKVANWKVLWFLCIFDGKRLWRFFASGSSGKMCKNHWDHIS